MKSPGMWGQCWWGRACDSTFTRCFLWACKVRKDSLQLSGCASAFVSEDCRWLRSSEGLPALQHVDGETAFPLLLDTWMHDCRRGWRVVFPPNTAPMVPIYYVQSGSEPCLDHAVLKLLWPIGKRTSKKRNSAFGNTREKGIRETPYLQWEKFWGFTFPEPSLNLEIFNSGLLKGWPVHTKLP